MTTPGLPSGVVSGLTLLSMPDSAGDPMIDVAFPGAYLASVNAQRILSAVMINLDAHIGNISA